MPGTMSAPIPGPRGRFLVGNDWDYQRAPDGYLEECRDRYGDVFRFDKGLVVASAPEIVRQILVGTNTTFTAVTDSASMTDEWMQGRRRAGRALNAGFLSTYAHRLDDTIAGCFAEAAGRESDMVLLARHVCSRSSVDFCVHDGGKELEPLTAEFGNQTVIHLEGDGKVLGRASRASQRRRAEVNEACHRALARHVEERRGQPPADVDRDMLDVLVATRRDEPPLTTDHICGILKAILPASQGVPGAALAWLAGELATNSEAREKVRGEAHLLPRAVEAANPQLLPYTHALAQEILRVHPPMWLLGRVANQPFRLGEWTVDEGERVCFSPHVLHNDPRWWDRPHDFMPERWLESRPPHTPHAYVPFGAGPRVCVGAQVGMLQLTLAAARLARDYTLDVVQAGGTSSPPSVLREPAGLRVRLTRVSADAGERVEGHA